MFRVSLIVWSVLLTVVVLGVGDLFDRADAKNSNSAVEASSTRVDALVSDVYLALPPSP